MVLTFGLISPHPPIIIPEIGKDDLVHVRTTIDALKHAVTQLADTKPDKLIIISPHTEHGFEVPRYYLRQQLPDTIEADEILVTEPSYQYYYDYGRTTAQTVENEQKRCAIVASGDLSHVLKADGPYGYDAAGPLLDKTIVAAVRQRDAKALLNLDPKTLEAGAECGLRSILFLLGAFEATNADCNVLSYEGPFGVGYMVATIAPQLLDIPSTTMGVVRLAREAIQQYLSSSTTITPPPQLPEELRLTQAGAFVSLHEKTGELRGCIGTIIPTQPSLAEEVIANAIAAATQDPRFTSVTLDEFKNLDISVDVLTIPKEVEESARLNPKTDGLIVKATDGRQGVLLPNLDGVDTVEQQIAICRQKAGIQPNEPITLYHFSSTRYEQ